MSFFQTYRSTSGLFTLALMLTLGSAAFGQPSVDRIRQIDRMIDAMASRNKPPVLVHESGGDSDSPFVPRDPYDWSEQERVQKAIKAVQDDKSDEMWRRLPAHYGDKRYAMTLVFDGVVNSKDGSVGEICAAMPGPDYDAACIRHFPKVSGRYVFNPASIMADNKWAGRPLYEQQITVCEEAINQFNSLTATEAVHAGANDYRAEEEAHVFTAEEKAKFTEAVRKEIEELKRTKKPVVGPGKPLGIYASAWEPLIVRCTKNARTYEKMLYDLGAFPVAKLTKPYWTNGSPGKVYSKGRRVDVDGWLPPYSVPGYLTDAEKAHYGIPKKPLTYEQYIAMLDIDTYKRTHAPMLFLVMRFALESMEREEVRIRKEDILRVYEARIGLEEFAVRLLREQLSSADAIRLVRTYGDEKLFSVLPAPQAADKAYVAFLAEQAGAPRWSISCRQDAYKLLFVMDENAYRKPYREFLLSHVQMAKDWWVRVGLYDGLVRLKDAESMKAIQEALVHDPITECREAILYDLKEQGEVASAIDAILMVANGQDEKHHPVTPSRMEMGWTYCLTEYLKWAKSQKGLDAETSRKVDEAIEKLQGSETPQALIATYRHALAAKDWRRCFSCYAPKMRGDFLIRTFYATAVSRDAELAAIVKKRLRIEFTDPERMPLPSPHRDDRVPKEVSFYETIQKQVDDLPRFVDEMCRRFDALGQGAFSKLGDVRDISIQGDSAVGYWKRSPSKGDGQSLSDNRVPVHFRKIGRNWYMAIPDPPPPLSVSDRVKLLKAEVESLFVYLACSTGAVDPFAEPSQSQTAQPFSDKRYDELRLTVRPVYGGNAPTVHVARLTEAQAKKLIEYLANEGFLQHAVELGKQDVPERDLSQNCYALQVSTQSLQLHEDLGWGPGMLKRLDGLRRALDGEAARGMDAILAGLADDRKKWAMTTTEPATSQTHQ